MIPFTNLFGSNFRRTNDKCSFRQNTYRIATDTSVNNAALYAYNGYRGKAIIVYTIEDSTTGDGTFEVIDDKSESNSVAYYPKSNKVLLTTLEYAPVAFDNLPSIFYNLSNYSDTQLQSIAYANSYDDYISFVKAYSNNWQQASGGTFTGTLDKKAKIPPKVAETIDMGMGRKMWDNTYNAHMKRMQEISKFKNFTVGNNSDGEVYSFTWK